MTTHRGSFILLAQEEKVKRDAFLYLDPKEPEDEFAQCATCGMWTGEENKTCTIHGKNVEVTGDMTCGLYVHGEPMVEMAGKEHEAVTPEESGLMKAAVRCENCASLVEGNLCELFDMLNTEMGWDFGLDIKVNPKGCCNAWRGKG